MWRKLANWERSSFAWRCIAKRLRRQDTDCPFCDTPDTEFVARKNWLLQLRRCSRCGLMFRWPKESSEENERFYQRHYRDHSITDPPAGGACSSLDFSDDDGLGYGSTIALLKSMAPHGRLLDYGASWGYHVAQFKEQGYDAVGFEISEERAEIGRRRLGVTIVSDTSNLIDCSFDIIHCSHVLEHIPDLRPPFLEFNRLLRPGGLLLAFAPNANGTSARRDGARWPPMINQHHVLALTAEFFARNLPRYGFATLLFATSPFTCPAPLEQAPQLDGGELMIVGRAGP